MYWAHGHDPCESRLVVCSFGHLVWGLCRVLPRMRVSPEARRARHVCPHGVRKAAASRWLSGKLRAAARCNEGGSGYASMTDAHIGPHDVRPTHARRRPTPSQLAAAVVVCRRVRDGCTRIVPTPPQLTRHMAGWGGHNKRGASLNNKRAAAIHAKVPFLSWPSHCVALQCAPFPIMTDRPPAG